MDIIDELHTTNTHYDSSKY